MGVENADDAATWKATMSILRRQKLLPLLEEADACEEEDIIISIMILLCFSCSFAFRSRIQAGGEQSGQVVLMMVWCVVVMVMEASVSTIEEDACSSLYNNGDLLIETVSRLSGFLASSSRRAKSKQFENNNDDQE